MPDISRIKGSIRALTLFNDLRLTPEGSELSPKAPAEWTHYAAQSPLVRGIVTPAERDAAALLCNAARILWTAYYSMGGQNGKGDPHLIRLRTEARKLFEREWQALALDIRPRVFDRLPPVNRGGLATPVQLDNLPLAGFVHGALWAERAKDHEAFVHKLLSSQIVGEGRIYDLILTRSRWSDHLRVGASP